MSHPLRDHWVLDPAVTFLNHGSFGACPRVVLDFATHLREHIEREPVRFFVGELERMADQARATIADLVGARADDLVFVPNATAGVSTVLRSIELRPGDEVLTTDHEYNACRNALDRAAAAAGAHVRVAAVPFPLRSSDAVLEAVLAVVTARTRLALLDHVTSPTALVLPVERLVAELEARGVDTLVDAAHAPGMVPMNLDRVGATYTTGNFHKWLCAPKGAAFLHVREDRQRLVRPLATSHGANSERRDRSRFRLEFDWTGTADPAPFLAVPEALRFLASLAPGGVSTWMARNHEAAVWARRALCEAMQIEPACPDEMLGAMASLPPAAGGPREEPFGPLPFDPLQEELYQRFRIEVPVFPWPAPPRKILRVSTPAYVTREDVTRLVEALVELGVAHRGSR